MLTSPKTRVCGSAKQGYRCWNASLNIRQRQTKNLPFPTGAQMGESTSSRTNGCRQDDRSGRVGACLGFKMTIVDLDRQLCKKRPPSPSSPQSLSSGYQGRGTQRTRFRESEPTAATREVGKLANTATFACFRGELVSRLEDGRPP